MPQLPELLYSVPMTLWQATVHSHVHQSLLDTHSQVWLSLLWSPWVLVHIKFYLCPPEVRRVWRLKLNVIIMYILEVERESELCLKAALLFHGCSSLVFESTTVWTCPSGSLVVSLVKNLPAIQETWVRSLGQEDSLESKGWQLNSVFLPGEFHGQQSLAGYSPWDYKESDLTEQPSLWNSRKAMETEWSLFPTNKE